MQSFIAFYLALAILAFAERTLMLESNAEEVTLQFSNQIVLINTLPNSSALLDKTFETDVSAILNNAVALPVTPLTATAYENYPHVVVTSTAWSTGQVANAETGINALEAVFNKWQLENNISLQNELSDRIALDVQQRPNYVTVTNNCRFYNTSVNAPQVDVCSRNLSVSIYSSLTNDGTVLQNILCGILPTECDLITHSPVTSTSVRSPISGLITPYTKIDFDIYAQDRNWLFVNLINYAHYASALSLEQIAYIVIDGSEVFGLGNYTTTVVIGTVQECLPHYWYLIFLIIFVFVIAIISHQCYYRGRFSGRRSARKAEAEIRAGQHMASMAHANFSAIPPTSQYGYVPFNNAYANSGQIINANNTYTQWASPSATNNTNFLTQR